MGNLKLFMQRFSPDQLHDDRQRIDSDPKNWDNIGVGQSIHHKTFMLERFHQVWWHSFVIEHLDSRGSLDEPDDRNLSKSPESSQPFDEKASDLPYCLDGELSLVTVVCTITELTSFKNTRARCAVDIQTIDLFCHTKRARYLEIKWPTNLGIKPTGQTKSSKKTRDNVVAGIS